MKSAQELRKKVEKKLEIEKTIAKNVHHFEKIEEICENIGEKIEGNCFTSNLDITTKPNDLKYKQQNLYHFSKTSSEILEVGFNAGHSCLIFLLANKTSHITCFDVCIHTYTIPCFEYLAKEFPGRISLIKGDSRKTIPAYLKKKRKFFFDLIHIDGGHMPHIANSDFYQTLKYGNKFLIFDDTQMSRIQKLLKYYLSFQYIETVSQQLETKIYCHEIFKYKQKYPFLKFTFEKMYMWFFAYIFTIYLLRKELIPIIRDKIIKTNKI